MFNSTAYTLVTPPASEPVALADVKAFLRIDGTDDDAILTILIASARRAAEEYTKRAFITQTWRLAMDRFGDEVIPPPGYHVGPTPFLVSGGRTIQLSRQPIQSITSIATLDTSNTSSTVSPSVYALDTDNGRIMLNDGYSWPTDLRENAAVLIIFVAGWANAAAVPESIKQAIILHVSASYASRTCADIPEGAKALLDAFRLPEAFGAF